MKRIVRLTESDLTRIVKRVIRENNRSLLREGVGTTAAKKLYDALSGNFFDDNEAQALIAVKMVKTCADVIEFSKGIKNLTGKSVPQYIDSEMSSADSEYDQITDYFYKITKPCMEYDVKKNKYEGPNTFNDGNDSLNNIIRWIKGDTSTKSNNY
jgi:hypothetical protein